jgi:hypothetical protein
MKDPHIDLLAIGNAIVDVLAQTDEAFVERQGKLYGMVKGAMTLIDERRAVELYAEMPAGIESSGGSAGNTIAGFASFGGKGAYIGKVAKDQLGDVFSHDLKSQGVVFQTQPLAIGAPTARCLVLVTPDGQRTMNTFLGAAVELSPIDIDEELVSSSPDYIPRRVSVRSAAREGSVPRGIGNCAQGWPQGVAVIVRSVLREPSPCGSAGVCGKPRRYPVRQRGRSQSSL